MPQYIKHLIECKCILPQFRKLPQPIWHKFIVFSQLEDDGSCKTSYAQCPNCLVVHKIIEIGLSQVLNKESSLALQTIEDIKTSLPDWLVMVLEKHMCDLPTWQEAKFVLENEMWGQPIILSKEREGDVVIGKYLLIMGKTLHKIEIFERFDGLV